MNCFEFELHLLPYGDDLNRQQSIDQLEACLNQQRQGDPLSSEQLLALINSLADEHADEELSLEELEQLSGGVGLVDAMVSSSILMVVVSQSAGIFGASINATGNSALRDGINAAISADMELVRQNVDDWAKDSTMGGQLAYDPDEAHCVSGTLGQALLDDPNSELSSGTTQVAVSSAISAPQSESLNDSEDPAAIRESLSSLKGTSINRTVSVDPNNHNLIRISYATADGSPIKVSQSSTLVTPAQAWCGFSGSENQIDDIEEQSDNEWNEGDSDGDSDYEGDSDSDSDSDGDSDYEGDSDGDSDSDSNSEQDDDDCGKGRGRGRSNNGQED